MPMQPVRFQYCLACRSNTLHYIKRMGDMISEQCDVCKNVTVRHKEN